MFTDSFCVQDLQIEQLVEAELMLRLECYNNWICLADLAWDVSNCASQQGSMDELVWNALDSAASSSKAFFDRVKLVSPLEIMCNDIADRYDILSPDDIVHEKKTRKEHLERRKLARSRPILEPGQRDASWNQRGDVAPNMDRWKEDANAPRRLTIREGPRRRPKDKPRASGYSNIGFSAAIETEEAAIDPARQPKRYRDWGDQLLGQTIT